MQNYLIIIFFLTGLITFNYSQDDIQIGTYGDNRYPGRGAFFDYSDPDGINIKVQLWGYVEFPGYYIIPEGSTINELISFAGGPNEDALLEDIRVMKIKVDKSTEVVKYNYNDLMWEEEVGGIKITPLQAGDVVVVPGEPRYFIRQDISFYLSIITALASVAALIISITNN